MISIAVVYYTFTIKISKILRKYDTLMYKSILVSHDALFSVIGHIALDGRILIFMTTTFFELFVELNFFCWFILL